MISTLAHYGTVRNIRAPARYIENALVVSLYRDFERGLAAVPPLFLHESVPEIMAGVWMLFAEELLAEPATVSRVVKESIAAAVSYANECPYCVDAHCMMIHGAGNPEIAESIRNGKLGSIRDPALRTLLQ
jgi:AhpD family alkylhydroperoxidase